MAKILIVILFLHSCAPLKEDQYMIGWVGLPVSELGVHPYFSKLPTRVIQRSAIKKTLEYREPKGQRSSAECETIGGCVGLQYLADCVYEFEVETTIIVSATLHGQCKRDPQLLPQ